MSLIGKMAKRLAKEMASAMVGIVGHIGDELEVSEM